MKNVRDWKNRMVTQSKKLSKKPMIKRAKPKLHSICLTVKKMNQKRIELVIMS